MSPAVHTLLMLYVGGGVAQALRSVASWREVRTIPKLLQMIAPGADPTSRINKTAMAVGVVFGVVIAALRQGLTWPYRLVRHCIDSIHDHPGANGVIIELSYELWRLQMIALCRLDDSTLSRQDAQRELTATYSELIDTVEDLLTDALPTDVLRPPHREYTPPSIENAEDSQ